MGSYISYIIDGIWEAKQCILLGIKYGFKYLVNLTPAMGCTLQE